MERGILLSLIKYLNKVALAGFSYLPSELKIFIYRCLGSKIGKNVELGLGSFVVPLGYDFKKIHIGDDVTLGDGVHIFSNNFSLGTGTQIKDNTRISGHHDFTTGKNVYIDQECHFDLRRDISLGSNIGIGGGSWFYTHMVFHQVLDGAPYNFGPIIIEDGTYVGGNVFVLPGVTIGRDATIGARSVVTKNVNSDTIVVGQPAKGIAKTSERTRNLTPEEKNIIVKDILVDFMHVYQENIIPVKSWDNLEMIFLFRNRTVLFLPRPDLFSVIDEKMKKHKKPGILISFGIPEPVKAECEKNSISWFDLESRTRSATMDRHGRILERYFGNHGISIS